jgi:hypothetical protein
MDHFTNNCRKIYQYLHSKRIYAKTGNYGKKIKNWDKIEKKDDWLHIQKLANLIEKSGNQIDYRLLIDSLFEFSNNEWFKLNLLYSPKGIAIYKNALKKREANVNPEYIKKEIIRSVKFIVRFCKANNINEFSDYFNHNVNLFPTILSHLNSGVISKHFFELIPNVVKRIYSFPQDIRYDFFNNKEEEMIMNKNLNLARSSWIRKFAMDFDAIFEELLQAKN